MVDLPSYLLEERSCEPHPLEFLVDREILDGQDVQQIRLRIKEPMDAKNCRRCINIDL